MTTITINEDLPLKKSDFNSLSELFEALEEQNLFVVLQELSVDDVSDDMQKKAEKTVKEWNNDPSEFADV